MTIPADTSELASTPRRPVRPALRTGMVLALLIVLTGVARAQPYRYGIQNGGRVIVDTALLEKSSATLWDIQVIGSDRWTLKTDGTLSMNGVKVEGLPKFLSWIDLEVRADGMARDVYTIRQDGLLWVNGGQAAFYPITGANAFFFFTAIDVVDGVVWALRSDGMLFQDADDNALFDFGGVDAGQPYFWVDVAINPTDGVPYALRSDGHVFIGNNAAGDAGGFTEIMFPAPYLDAPFDLSGLYTQILFKDDGTLLALRGNGRVYSSEAPLLVPVVDFAGNDPLVSSNQLFYAMTVFNDLINAIRYDGKVYVQPSPGTPLFTYEKSGYLAIAMSDEAPNLDNIKNVKPVVATYKVTTYGNDTVVVPVVATDIDKDSDQLVITVKDEDELPAGITWDAVARTLTFDSSLPVGSYKVTVLVDDGVNKPVKGKYTVKVKEPETDPDKNKKPVPAKIKKVQALVGFEYALEILAYDPNRDTLTIEPDMDMAPFTIPGSDASWDAKTNTLTWTPTLLDIGKVKPVFYVSDEQFTKKLKVKMSVVNPLPFDTGDDDGSGSGRAQGGWASGEVHPGGQTKRR